ncbi:hypothetical protein LXA43DRAFT_49233 [Ganoderma leucocontextum]|nr:hypothetical protein LXA43DRAFT_49233 [Ganoderma leucocontextum]
MSSADAAGDSSSGCALCAHGGFLLFFMFAALTFVWSRRTLLTRLYYPGSRALASPIAVLHRKKSPPYHTYIHPIHRPSIHHTSYIHTSSHTYTPTYKEASIVHTHYSPYYPNISHTRLAALAFLFVGCWLFRFSSCALPRLFPALFSRSGRWRQEGGVVCLALDCFEAGAVHAFVSVVPYGLCLAIAMGLVQTGVTMDVYVWSYGAPKRYTRTPFSLVLSPLPPQLACPSLQGA